MSGTTASFDIRAMLLAKLAQLASQSETAGPPLLEGRSEERASENTEPVTQK
jgi:hypothetical protein